MADLDDVGGGWGNESFSHAMGPDTPPDPPSMGTSLAAALAAGYDRNSKKFYDDDMARTAAPMKVDYSEFADFAEAMAVASAQHGGKSGTPPSASMRVTVVDNAVPTPPTSDLKIDYNDYADFTEAMVIAKRQGKGPDASAASASIGYDMREIAEEFAPAAAAGAVAAGVAASTGAVSTHTIHLPSSGAATRSSSWGSYASRTFAAPQRPSSPVAGGSGGGDAFERAKSAAERAAVTENLNSSPLRMRLAQLAGAQRAIHTATSRAYANVSGSSPRNVPKSPTRKGNVKFYGL